MDTEGNNFQVLAWRPGQANDAFQALKRHFDVPPGTVEFTGFAAGEGYCVKGSNKNDPRGGGQRAAGDGIASFFAACRALARDASAACGGLRNATSRRASGGAFLRATQMGLSRTPVFPAAARAARISNGLPFPSSQRAPSSPCARRHRRPAPKYAPEDRDA